jgi:3-hydroxy acid dehydrogenase / malonic semialdehyde reductase
MKTALIFGASSGYGEAIANLLRENNYNVISLSRAVPKSKCYNRHYFCDLEYEPSIIQSMSQISEDFTDVDVVIYSSGIAIGKNTIEDNSFENIKNVFQVNTLSFALIAKLSIPMLREKQGALILIGSIASYFTYYGGGDYCASKSASTILMKTLRFELLGSGIRTTTIQPGLGDTNFQSNRYKGDANKAKIHYDSIKQLEPIDVANAALWVLSQPKHVNIDEIIIKPINQATHGVIVGNKQF